MISNPSTNLKLEKIISCHSCIWCYSPPARWGLLDFMSVACSSPPLLSSSCSTATLDAQCSLSDLNHDHPRPVFPAGPQPRPSPPSVPCRTSTTTIHAQCSLPDLNREYPRQVFPAGPHVGRYGTKNVQKKVRMSDKYVIYYLQTRACVVEWPGQCHFLLCRWQSLKQSVWTDDRVTGVDRDISTSVPLELFAKTLETGNILQQVTTNYLKWSHAGLMLETVNITQGFCCVSQLWWHGGYVTSEHLLEHLSPHLLDRGPQAGWTSS